MFLDNLLPSYLGAITAPAAMLKRLRYPDMVSFGLLANLSAMHKKSVIIGIDSIWDVGANRGQFAFMAHSVWPDLPIYSFEPDPDSFARLQHNFSKFGIPGQPMNIGLGAEEGVKELVRYSDDVNNSFLARELELESEQSKVAVSCSTLDLISKPRADMRAAFLKLDVQGSELTVIAGAGDFLGRCRYVLAEVSFSSAYSGGAHADEVMLAMRQCGFECIQILDVLRGAGQQCNAIQEADMLFFNTKWADMS
jgi:FkbM family methyltransferase